MNFQWPWEIWKLAPPTWEAMAALLAVLAAWQVGRRQLEIQRQQEVIAINQLKMQLLQKRLECIQQLREIDSARFNEGEITEKNWQKLRIVLQSAIILFPKNISNRLDIAANSAWIANNCQDRADFYLSIDKKVLADRMVEDVIEQQRKVREVLDGIVPELEEISRIDFWD